MQDDPRCCGTGTCLINAEGVCWCGQKWDGEKMGFAPLAHCTTVDEADKTDAPSPQTKAN